MTAQETYNINETVTEETKNGESRWNFDYILDRMEAIVRDTAYLSETVEALAAMPPAEGPAVDIAGQAKATALADIVRCRETTHQQLIGLYTKMYEDLRPRNDIFMELLRIFDSALEQTPPSGRDVILMRMNALAESMHPNSQKIGALNLVQNTIDKVEDTDLLPEVLKNLNEILAGMELYH